MKRTYETRTLISLFDNWRLYDPNPPFQRQSGIWSSEAKYNLITNLFNGYDITQLYYQVYEEDHKRRVSEGFHFGICDGKQRMETIMSFMRNEYPLSKTFIFIPPENCYLEEEDYPKAGQFFKDITPRAQNYFNTINISCVMLIGYTDDQMAFQFIYLNLAFGLTTSEKQWAIPSQFNELIKSISNHEYYKEKVNFSNKRYKQYSDALYICVNELLYMQEPNKTSKEAKDIGICDFSNSSKNLKEKLTRPEYNEPVLLSRLQKRLQRNYDFMSKTFSDKEHLLKGTSRSLTFYIQMRRLREQYKISPALLLEALQQFEYDSAKLDTEDGTLAFKKPEFNMYHIASQRSTHTLKNISIRVNILHKYIIDYCTGHKDFIELDFKRLFSPDMKYNLWMRANQKCEVCNTPLSMQEVNGDHNIPWAEGGQTTLENGRCLCVSCNSSKKANTDTTNQKAA
jgi:hypothetical protein|tara:strand:+ start:161 stop:1525 length:1365 start_codon:yes stop_codon:yes gene_type:complete